MTTLNFSYEDFENQTLAIISDIHSNDFGFKAAIDLIHQHKVGKVIFLGDLLTLGCAPQQVIDHMQALQKEYAVYFIKGNHDQYCFDLQAGRSLDAYKLPNFITESIKWNVNNLKLRLETAFEWLTEITIGKILFSHSNPYGGNWRYIITDADCIEASTCLHNRGFQIGCFGHTHSPSITVVDKIKGPLQKNLLTTTIPIAESTESIILNPGSIGMCRGPGFTERKNFGLLFLHFKKNELNIQPKKIELPLYLQRQTVLDSNLSGTTKNELMRLYAD